MSLTTSEMTPADIAAVTGGYRGGGGGFGDDNGNAWWVILFIILAMSGAWGNNGNGGGMNGGGGWNGSMPWILNNTDNDVERGFDQMATTNGIQNLQNAVTSGFANASTQLCNCCGDIQMALCNGFAGVNQTVNGGFANAETAANARQMANMQQGFGIQTAITGGLNNLSTQFADCCCENRLASADLKYTIATENCADRYEAAQNTRDIIENANRNNQSILDKLCQLELDAKNDKISDLERQLTMANLAASQIAQTAEIQRGQVGEVDALYQRLRDCPVPTQPVYGSQPIFTCPNNNGCGCNTGCGNF